MLPKSYKLKDKNIACQGASEAIRRRATLDTADAGQSRIEYAPFAELFGIFWYAMKGALSQ